MTQIDDAEIKPLENKFFKRLYNIALSHMESSEKMVAYHACFVVRGGTILGTGVNNKKQNSLVRLHYEHFCGFHSEISAIMDAKKSNLAGTDVYVLRVRPDGKIAYSAPCEMCFAVLSRIGVKRAFFSTEDEKIGMIKVPRIEPKKQELYLYRSMGLAIL